MLTTSGTTLGILLGGAVVVETVFSWPGVGRLAAQGILNNDSVLVVGFTLFVATMMVLVNFVGRPPLRGRRSASAILTVAAASAERRDRGPGFLRRNKLAMLGSAVFLALLVVGAVAPYMIPASVVRDVRFAEARAADAEHWFGTDDYGRDLFSMVLLAANLDLRAAIEGRLGGDRDRDRARRARRVRAPPRSAADADHRHVPVDSQPGAGDGDRVGARTKLENLSIALIFVSWPIYCRLMRGQVLSEKEKPYVRRSSRPGRRPIRLIFRHIIPNAIFPVIARAARRCRADPDHDGGAQLYRLRARALRPGVGQPDRRRPGLHLPGPGS